MKTAFICTALLFLVCGCTNTKTFYDANGKITRVDKNTDFSRAMDGTNSKSQIVLLDGRFFQFEASATAGENCTPGVTTKFLSGKAAVVNARDNANYKGTDKIVKEFFFEEVTVGTDGINVSKPAGTAAATGK